MHDQQEDIYMLHRALSGTEGIGLRPEVREHRVALRRTLVGEEAQELDEALWNGNLVEICKEMCDLIVVTYGTAVEFGVDLEPHWDEVHRSNMAKVGGKKRSDGKFLKPDGWTPPDLESILIRQGARF